MRNCYGSGEGNFSMLFLVVEARYSILSVLWRFEIAFFFLENLEFCGTSHIGGESSYDAHQIRTYANVFVNVYFLATFQPPEGFFL